MKFKILLMITAIGLLGCNQGGLKMKVRFDDTGGLKNGDRVYHQEEVVGVVTDVLETDEKKHLASLALKKETAAKATRQNRFYIDQDPKEGNRSAVVMVAGQ
ncbi:MAG: MlaD family protein, partial [Thermodesulfobacteriota bacterium]|nr:MlaD family protein [Thermodesulfobacteriota bacterium]